MNFSLVVVVLAVAFALISLFAYSNLWLNEREEEEIMKNIAFKGEKKKKKNALAI